VPQIRERSYRLPATCGYQQAGGLAVNAFDRGRLLSALILVVMALFVASGTPGAARWRRPMRQAAILGFLVAVALAVIEIALWTGSD
jgi:hypothetical protein